jgi:hypothetical protein
MKSSLTATGSRCTLANEAVQIFTRRGHDWTNRFKKVSHDAWHIKAASAVIHGEIVVPAADTMVISLIWIEAKKGPDASGPQLLSRGTSALRGRSLFVDAFAGRHRIQLGIGRLFLVQVRGQEPDDVIMA